MTMNLRKAYLAATSRNCKHRSLKCNAYIENGFVSPLSEITEENYISFSRQSEEFSLYVSDANGSNRKELAKTK